ncbi:MAG: hypothetical protein HOJ22_07085 [Chloroflexi bacterium]|nr:hypothetical protein [Chloroflexota bacterium]MBT5628040.1 hypothetical protein [Chloroflexota bacterium]
MKSSNSKIALIGLSLMTVLLIFSGCGGEAEPEAISKITPVDTIYSLDDLLAVEFKKSKTFDVEGLTGATAAYFGFWGVDPYDRKDYEVRFYPSHDDAVQLGTEFIEERTGENAILVSGRGMWEEGIKEARVCAGNDSGSGANCTISKYGDYVIHGNMIMACQGADSPTALQQCADLIARLTTQSLLGD